MLDPNDGYDMANLKACATSVGQMTNDIVLVNPPESQEESLYGTAGDEGIYGAAEEIYCVYRRAWYSPWFIAVSDQKQEKDPRCAARCCTHTARSRGLA